MSARVCYSQGLKGVQKRVYDLAQKFFTLAMALTRPGANPIKYFRGKNYFMLEFNQSNHSILIG